MIEAVGAFTPNVPWAKFELQDGSPNVLIGRDGGGTSSATPQVAAAAALWLQKHRSEFAESEWRSWRKTEAVYQTLFRSADATHDRPYPRHSDGRTVGRYFGNGLLRAERALALDAPADCKSTAGACRFAVAPAAPAPSTHPMKPRRHQVAATS